MVHAREKTLSCCIGTSLAVQQASCFHSRWQIECFLASALGKGIFLTKPLDPLGLAADPTKGDRNLDKIGCER